MVSHKHFGSLALGLAALGFGDDDDGIIGVGPLAAWGDAFDL